MQKVVALPVYLYQYYEDYEEKKRIDFRIGAGFFAHVRRWISGEFTRH